LNVAAVLAIAPLRMSAPMIWLVVALLHDRVKSSLKKINVSSLNTHPMASFWHKWISTIAVDKSVDKI